MFGTFEPFSLIKPIQLAHADRKNECKHFGASLNWHRCLPGLDLEGVWAITPYLTQSPYTNSDVNQTIK